MNNRILDKQDYNHIGVDERKGKNNICVSIKI